MIAAAAVALVVSAAMSIGMGKYLAHRSRLTWPGPPAPPQARPDPTDQAERGRRVYGPPWGVSQDEWNAWLVDRFGTGR